MHKTNDLTNLYLLWNFFKLLSTSIYIIIDIDIIINKLAIINKII